MTEPFMRNGHEVPDDFGIVSKARSQRETYGHFLERRHIHAQVTEVLEAPATQDLIARLVNERLKKEVDAIVAREAEKLARETDRGPAGPPVPEILKAVSDATGASVGELLGPRRARIVARPRQMAYWLIRKLRPDLSFPKIAHLIGGRDHTSVLHGIRAFDRLREAENDDVVHWLEHSAIKALLP